MKKADRVALYGEGREYWRRLRADIVRDRWLLLLLLPGLIYFVIFKYLPMCGAWSFPLKTTCPMTAFSAANGSG